MDQSQAAKAKLSERVGEQIDGLLSKGQSYAVQLGSQAQTQLRQRPFIAVAGALALGFIVGALLARRSGR